MRVGIAADSHGAWASLDRWAIDRELDLVVHCGDVGTTDQHGVPVFAALGNHDQHPTEPPARPTFVPDYQLLELAGLRWLFIGCCSNKGDVAAPPDGLPAADVLVSHESPFNPHLGWSGHPIVRQIVEQVQPGWCFSGHWHHLARGAVGATRCVALGADPSEWLVAEVVERTLVMV